MKRFPVKVAFLRFSVIALLCTSGVFWSSLSECLAADHGNRQGAEQRPKLVVLIMIDQLRGDLPLRYASDFGEGGFKYLMTEGVWYTAAQHPHSHTETVVGHSTVSTGAYPAAHGMIGNAWFGAEEPSADGSERSASQPESSPSETSKPGGGKKIAFGAHSVGHGGMEPGWLKRARAWERRERGQAPEESEDESVDSVEDGTYKIVGTKDAGASPVDILTNTFGDELTVTTAQGAKVFAVSVKDRAAVALAGHSGKAFWFNSNNGQFVSSTYYYDAYPTWVDAWNDASHGDQYLGKAWELSQPHSDYLYGDQDDQPWEPELMGYGRVFPHEFGNRANPIFYTKLTISPVGDELTLSFVRDLIENEGLGQDEVTDFLGVSLSCNDIIGHWYGPSSLESEVSIRTLDRNLAGFFAYLDEKVGLENTVIALAGDHGIPEVPEYLETLKVPTGRISEEDIEALGRQALAQLRPNGEALISGYEHPYFYLDREKMVAARVRQIEVERYLAASLEQHEAILFAVPSTDLRWGGEELNREMIDRIRRNQNPGRSGDVYVVQATQWQVGQPPASDEPVVIVNHGSPWAYDTYVPIAFAGRGISGGLIDRQVLTVDIAPTLALMVGAKPPTAAVGVPLTEVLEP